MLTSTIKSIFAASLVFFFGICSSAHASSFKPIAYQWENYTFGALDWAVSDDDVTTDSVALGFSVTIGGATYSHFNMSSNGYIELLTDASDVPVDHGWGVIDGLISDDPSATYLLAAYDDLTSKVHGYHGYKLFSDPNRAVFYYDTETYEDTGVTTDQLNTFEVILYEDGNVQWNFYYAEYFHFNLDLYSGLYFGNTQTLLELTRYNIPRQKSYLFYGCGDWLTADFSNNCSVELADHSIFAQQMLACTELNDPCCLPIDTNGHTSSFRPVTYEWEDYSSNALDWTDSGDDASTGSTALDFSVTIGGATYSHFDMNSNGYIELLTDVSDVPTDYGWDSIDRLTSADPNATYMLAGYDDLSSVSRNYYGYKLFTDPNRAVFYYDTETYQDEGRRLLNTFEVILNEDGNVQWNFNDAQYEWFDGDLYSGLYLGNKKVLLELARYNIPEQESYLYEGCGDWLTADFNGDCIVDLDDFRIFALQWLECGDLNDPSCLP